MWLGRDGRSAAMCQQESSDSNIIGVNLYLWQRLQQDSSNSFHNTVAERTSLGGSVSNRNGSGETAVTVEVQDCLTGPCSSGGRDAADTSKQEQQQKTKLCLAATAGWQQGDSKMAVTATAAVKILICGKGCGNTTATAVTTWWRSELGLVVASATPMVAERQQQHWRSELVLQDLVVVTEKRWQLHQDMNYGSR